MPGGETMATRFSVMVMGLLATLSILAACSRPASTPVSWRTSLGRDHPLVGRIWDCRRRAWVEPDAVWQRLRDARIVLLGEKHDNPDHHRLQAAALAALVAGGRRPAVAFEMFDGDQQKAIDQYRARPSAAAGGLGEATGWQTTGWPSFEAYLPIVEVAFDKGLPIVAANLPLARVRAVVHEGARALGPEAAALGLDRPFPADLEASLEKELRASHCGGLPEAMLASMAVAQHARDAQMARALIDADKGQGAVLVAGAGHVRLDRGVPYYVRQRKAGVSTASVAFIEVVRGADAPSAYAEAFASAELPFDLVWFTPRASDDDPCGRSP
jgi:uncharacterized iron-regulated protein